MSGSNAAKISIVSWTYRMFLGPVTLFESPGSAPESPLRYSTKLQAKTAPTPSQTCTLGKSKVVKICHRPTCGDEPLATAATL